MIRKCLILPRRSFVVSLSIFLSYTAVISRAQATHTNSPPFLMCLNNRMAQRRGNQSGNSEETEIRGPY